MKLEAKLRRLARGQQCQLRLTECDPATVVLAHIRRAGIAGTGMKPPGLCGIYACHGCHEIMDGRRPTSMTRLELDRMILFGLLRTLTIVQKELDR